MAKRTYGPEYGFATRAVHTGNDVDAETGAIRRPITMANSYELPYEGAKPMLLVYRVEDRDFLKELLEAMYPELPAPKKKK